MAENIAPIFGGPAPGEPVPEIVEMLESLLAQARCGDLRGFAYAAARAGQAGHEFHFEADAKFEVASGVLALQHRVARILAGEED